MPKSQELSPEAQEEVVRTLETAIHDAEIVPANTRVGEWSKGFSDEHRGLIIYGNDQRATISNLYPGFTTGRNLADAVFMMAEQGRPYIEAVVKNFTMRAENPYLALMLRACLQPIDHADTKTVPFISSSWIINLAKDMEDVDLPDALSLLELSTDLDVIENVSCSRTFAKVEQLDIVSGQAVPMLNNISPFGALHYFKRTLLEGGEVDWHNLDIPENQS